MTFPGGCLEDVLHSSAMMRKVIHIQYLCETRKTGMVIATFFVDIIPHATRGDSCSVTEQMLFQSHRCLTPWLSAQCYLQRDQKKTDVQFLPLLQHPAPTGYSQSHTVTHALKTGSCLSISVQKFSRETYINKHDSWFWGCGKR